jgi:DNA replication protein DnaC
MREVREVIRLHHESGQSVRDIARRIGVSRSTARDMIARFGRSGLACALGHKACRDNRSVLYTRLPRLIDDLALAKGDGRIAARMKSLARVDLFILDDWGLGPLDGNARHHLLEILEDRYGRRSTLVTSQLPVARWHEMIGDPTYADAILYRLVHNAHRIELNGHSMRRHTSAEAA